MSFAAALRPPLGNPLQKPLAMRMNSLAKIMRSLWSGGGQGAWFDPSDFLRYTSGGAPVGFTVSNQCEWDPATKSLTFSNHTTYASASFGAEMPKGNYYRITGKLSGHQGVFNLSVNDNATWPVIATSDGMFDRVIRIAPNASTGTVVIYVNTYGAGHAGKPPTVVSDLNVYALETVASASMFQDSAGVTPVTAMEQPVGLMLDKRLGLVRDPELVTNGDFSGALSGWTFVNGSGAIVNGRLEVTATSVATVTARYEIPAVIGKTYEGLMTLISRDGPNIVTYTGGAAGVNTTALGNLRWISTANSAQQVVAIQMGASAVGQKFVIDDISIREIPGNHASQATTTARPLLSARKNLQLSSENFAVAPWSRTNTTVTANAVAGPDGSMTGWRWDNTPNTGSHVTAVVALPVGATATRTVRAKAISGTGILAVEIARDGVLGRVEFDLVSGTIPNNNVIGCVAQIIPVGNGWYDCVATFTASGAGSNQFQATYLGAFGVSPVATSIGVMYSQIEYGSASTRYQKVNTATDYDWIGFPLYLRFDGADDLLNVLGWDTLMDGTEPWFFAASLLRRSWTASAWPSLILRRISASPREESSVILNPALSFSTERWFNGTSEALASSTLNLCELSVLSGGYSADGRLRVTNATVSPNAVASPTVSAADLKTTVGVTTRIGGGSFDVQLYELVLTTKPPAALGSTHGALAAKAGAKLA